MLDTLQSIVRDVHTAASLDAALDIIVRRVKQAVGSDVCSIYLTDFERREHVLRATDGLRQEAVGRMALPLHRGLIGLVVEKLEPINLDDAPVHPRYVFAAETDEVRYHGFLGVPLIHNRKTLGVLVLRQIAPRRFPDNEVTMVFTMAAQVASAIGNFWSSQLQEREEPQSEEGGPHQLQGRPGSRGITLGDVVVVYPLADLTAVPNRTPENPGLEEDSFRTAVDAVCEDLRRLEDRMRGTLPEEDRALFQAWLLMLQSESLIDTTIRRIHEGNWAAGALRETIEEHARVFDKMEDSYLRERASDIRDLGRRVLTYLQQDTPRLVSYPDGTVLVGEEISPMQLAEVPPGKLAGVVSVTGSTTSHVAILARAMGVPAVMGVPKLPPGRLDGRKVIVDGYRGRVYISPLSAVWEEYARLAAEDRALGAELEGLRSLPSETPDGTPVPLYLNTGLMISEMPAASLEEAAGVGLYRTEMPFMVRDRFPSEAIQIANYQNVLKTFHPRPVTLRTLDVGGDKPLPYFPVEESNPFLGWRGIRICLDHPEIFLTQVRAMLRAAIGLDNLRILLPMICSVNEVETSLLLIDRAIEELREEGYDVRRPQLGVMIEVPAAVFQIREIARRVDFVSIGTNDLTQYLLAVDRNNAHVADLYDDFHPAVLRALAMVVEGAVSTHREVGICGELAGNPAATPLLIGMGVTHLSMNASSLLPVKAVVRNFSRARAKDLLRAALQKEDAAEVRRVAVEALEQVNLGGLVRPGR